MRTGFLFLLLVSCDKRDPRLDQEIPEIKSRIGKLEATRDPQPALVPTHKADSRAMLPEYVPLIKLIAKPGASIDGQLDLEESIANVLASHGNEIETILRKKIFDERGVVEDPLKTLLLMNAHFRKRSGRDGARRIWIHNFGAQMGSIFDSLPERAADAGLPPI